MPTQRMWPLGFVCAAALAAVMSGAGAAGNEPAARGGQNGIELSDVIRALLIDPTSAGLVWRDLETRLKPLWLPPAAKVAPPPGMPGNAAARQATLSVKVAGQPTRHAFQHGQHTIEGWLLTLWGDASGPASASLRGGDGKANLDLEAALRAAGLSYVIECETRSVRHFRLMDRSRKTAYAAQYTTQKPDQTEILFFWNPPPQALLERDGCLIDVRR